MTPPPIVLLGFGDVAACVLAQAEQEGREVWATSRRDEGIRALEERGIRAVRGEPTGACLSELPGGAHVAVTFPPDGRTDAQWAARLPAPSRLVYVSSTGVYPLRAGNLDDRTPAEPDTERGQRRLQAEAAWRARGAVVLRAPAIYGPARGLLQRLRAGSHRMTGDGSSRVSRIHIEDLASCVAAALQRGRPGAAHVVGDLHPASQREVIEYICEAEGLSWPQRVEAAHASPTLRGDRAVDPRPALRALGVTLRYPSYRDGLAPLLRLPGARGGRSN